MVQRKKKPDSCLGDIVIMKLPEALMAKVLEAKQDAKGLLRTVHLETKHSTLERPVTKVRLLLEATD